MYDVYVAQAKTFHLAKSGGHVDQSETCLQRSLSYSEYSYSENRKY